MKLRSKLSLGIGILFTLILIQGIQSIRYVRHLSVSSKEILSDNYNSVHYVSEMLRSLDRFSQDSASRRTLIEALTLQQQNITEINERQVTSALEEKVGRLNDSISGEEVQQIRDDLYRIMELNMGSILAKSRGMESSADEAVESYLAGNLAFDPDVHCDHHGEHHHDGSCGDHGCGSHGCGTHGCH